MADTDTETDIAQLNSEIESGVTATLERRKGPVGRARCVARVDGEVACEGLLTFALD